MLTKPESLKRETERRIAATVGLLSVLALAEPALASGRDERTTAYLPATMSKTQLNEFEQQIHDLQNLAGKGREKEAMQGLDQLSRSANPSQLLQLVHLVLDRSNPLHDAELGIQIVEFLSRQDTPLKGKAALALARYFASSIHLDDKETAILWARQSLANGEQEAHSLLGDLYSKSGLRLRDLNRALLHYRQLAQHGSIAPLVSFARMLHRTAVTPSECNIDALELIREVLPRLKVEARSGKAAAQKELGRLFWHGVGVAKDRQTAVDWLQKAAQKGDPGARSELAKIALEASGEARLDLLGSAAAEGNRRAVFRLSRIFT
ncbi:MAG: tetratricopeptide repeat protein, partial [Pseudomonadota bacterium]